MDEFIEDLDPALIENIGPWSERKHAIIQDYASAYTAIMANAKRSIARFEWDYIDGYAAAGLCRRKDTGEIVKGSALLSLDVTPPFHRYYFVELDERKLKILRAQTAQHPSVQCMHGNANVVIPRDLVPQIDFGKYRRAFCLLDPYQHKHLDWPTIASIGRSKTIDLLLHFPTMPMNRGALHRDGEVPDDAAAAMTRFWGDESWRDAAYVKRDGLFTNLPAEKATDIEFAEAFCHRLRAVGGFQGTTRPIPMLNSNGATLYYLIFALPIETATRAARSVAKYFINHPHARSRYESKRWQSAV